MGLIIWSVASMITLNYVLDAEPLRKYTQLSQSIPSQSDAPTKIVKVEGIDYLVVESRNGVGVTFLVNKNNLKKLGQIVSEISDEMDAEKLNNIIRKSQ